MRRRAVLTVPIPVHNRTFGNGLDNVFGHDLETAGASLRGSRGRRTNTTGCSGWAGSRSLLSCLAWWFIQT